MSLSRERADEFLYRGLAAAKSGNPNDLQEAEYYLEWVTITDADHDQLVEAWYWLSKITSDPERKRECLDSALAIRPSHPDARRDLAILNGKLKVEDMRVNPHATGAGISLASQVSAAEIKRFKCPKCGASVTYHVGMGRLNCQFCGAEIDEEGHVVDPIAGAPGSNGNGKGNGVSEQDWVSAIHTEAGHAWHLPQSRVLQCQGCGATVTFAPGLASAKCGYCGSPYAVRLAGNEMANLREPDGVVPFRLNSSNAIEWARHWLKERAEYVGVPGDLPGLAAFMAPMPVYLPFWTFDIVGDVQWSGWVREDEMMGVDLRDTDNAVLLGGALLGIATGNLAYTVDNLTTVAGNKMGRDQNLVHKEGAVGVVATNIPVPATRSLPEETLKKLTFEISQAIPYREDIIASWPAEVYTVSMSDASLVARQAAIKEGDDQIAIEAGQRPGESNNIQVDRTGLAVLSYKLLLLPIWTTTYTYKGASYRVVVNGQNGQTEGDIPRATLKKLLGR